MSFKAGHLYSETKAKQNLQILPVQNFQQNNNAYHTISFTSLLKENTFVWLAKGIKETPDNPGIDGKYSLTRNRSLVFCELHTIKQY
jgi:hypothetical protein